MSVIETLREAVIDGQVANASTLTNEALSQGITPDEIFSRALSPAMDEVGKRMQRNEFYIPEVLMAAKAMKSSAEIMKPVITRSGGAKSRGRVLMGTVKGDLHDIGKNLVIMMLDGAGFEVIDLGMDVSPARFVEAVRESRPQVVGMCALLTTTMLQMPKVIQGLEAEDLRSRVKVMVGGAPLNQSFAEEIGADGYGIDAMAAVDLVRAWVPATQESVI